MMKRFTLLLWLPFFLNAPPACAHTPEAVTLSTPSGNVFGTLLLPSSPARDHPVALLIAGSGPTDRDGNNMYAKNNALLAIADSLADHGIASLRYDKRGIAASKSAAPDESVLRFNDYVSDAAAWVAFLQARKQFNKVFIIGHSEGSLIAMAAARSAKTSGIVSLAGAGQPIDAILSRQLRAQLPAALYDTAADYLSKLRNGDSLSFVPMKLMAIFRPSVQGYIRSWIAYNPAAEAAALTVPLLIVQGDKDLQVQVEDAEQLHRANPGATYQIIPGMNHVLRNVAGGEQENMVTYYTPDNPLHPDLVPALVRFILKGA